MCFVGENEVYVLPMSVLLELELETSLDETVVGKHILALWSDGSCGKVQYAEAIILATKKESKDLYEFLYS